MINLIQLIIHITWITFLPFLELRASIPAGLIMAGNDKWLLVAVIAIIANIVLGILLFLILDFAVKLITRIKKVKKFYDHTVLKIQKKVHPYIQKYGTIGLAVFIGIPLPGSGVYTGAIGGKIFGFKFKEYCIATVLGVLIAGIIVTIVWLTGSSLFSVFIKK